ncbi:MAG: flagellar basal-body MS-ring/collar protein FliF [Stappiaceae bacterium]
MNNIFDFLKKIGAARMGAMGAVAAVMIGIFAIIIMRVSEPQMGALYTNLTFEDSNAIIEQLESMNIPFELKSEGSAILIPRENILRTRMQLAESGLPTGGSIGYEIFDKSDTLGATSFVQNINHVRAMEGELSRTIRSLARVVTARVHLVLPERQLFQRDRQDPSASIMIKARGSLDAGQIRAVQHLVASAVEGLSPERVSIIDESGRLLASGISEQGEGAVSAGLQDRTNQIERRLRQQVEEIVSSVVGAGRARVRVAADVDFNRITRTKENFDPDGQVVRSTQTREEAAQTVNKEGGVTVGNQIPNAGGAEGGSNQDQTNATEEVVNYEISRSTETEVVEAGSVRKLSVAVLVDGLYEPNADGKLVYTPRAQEQLEQIALLVRSAVGYDESRGDSVEVVNLQFAAQPQSDFVENELGMFDFTKDDMLYFAELLVLLIVSILTLLFAVRPLLKKLFEPEPDLALAGAAGGEGGAAILAADGTVIGSADEADPVNASKLPVAKGLEWIENAQAEGNLQADSIAKVADIINDYPTEAASIVRGWLDEAA